MLGVADTIFFNFLLRSFSDLSLLDTRTEYSEIFDVFMYCGVHRT
jgi:hypothetical protein